MAKHEPDDIYWNRYRERSLAEAAHHIRARTPADAGNKAAKAEDDNPKPPASEVE